MASHPRKPKWRKILVKVATGVLIGCGTVVITNVGSTIAHHVTISAHTR